MTEPVDETIENERKKRSETDSGSGSATAGFVRASSEGVVRASESDQNEIETQRKKRFGEGEGEAGSVTSGITRPSGEGVVKLTVDQTKRVWADFRHLDLNEVVSAVAEFFSEFPARASANCVVAWDNVRGIPIVNFAIKFGQDVAMAVRERTRESAVSVRRKYGINIKFKNNRGSMVMTAQGPQGAGLT